MRSDRTRDKKAMGIDKVHRQCKVVPGTSKTRRQEAREEIEEQAHDEALTPKEPTDGNT